MRRRLTAAIIARDEEATLAGCLAGLGFADEVLVLVDAATRDRTASIAQSYGARAETRPFDSFAGQRDAALALAGGDWVLFVDADERVGPALRDEVLRLVSDPGGHRGFWIPRLNVLMGRVVRNGGWFPDYQLRLLQRGEAHFDPRRPVHEVPIVDGSVGYVESPFVHYNYRTLSEFVHKQERYCRLDAERWLRTFGRPRTRALLGQPLREFWRRFVSLGGYRDGTLGVVLSLILAWYSAKAIWLARRIPSPTARGAGGKGG
jgi:(heptosyl)LPS beta-1,4-glucosyltransferase